MVDIDLLVKELRQAGHVVADTHPVPSNAGEYELTVDGVVLNLADARELLEKESNR